MPRIMRGRTLVVSTITSLVISVPAAFALMDDAPSGDEGDETTDTTVMWEVDEDAPIPYAFDAEQGILILDLEGAKADDEPGDGEGDGEGDSEARMCLPSADAEAETEGDSVTEGGDGEDTELPEGCLEIDVTGPNGQINHGSVVSNTVHALKEVRDELDGPLGHYIREIAKSDLGKGGDDTDDDGDEVEEAEDGKPEKADKADEDTGRPDHAGNGNGNAPGHSNAGGNGKGKNK